MSKTHYEFRKTGDASRGKRLPLRTITELAEEFGVSRHSLATTISHDGTAPKPVFRSGSGLTARNTWYDHQAMRAWWSARGQK